MALRSAVRIMVIGGFISFRALFNWTHPAMYVPTLLVAPLLQLVFFVYLGRYAGAHSTQFYVIGNSILVLSLSCLFGGTFAVANERWYRTLGLVLASPANRAALFVGRGLPCVANGFIVSVTVLAVAVLLFDVDLQVSALPTLALAFAVAAWSCTGFGLTLGAIGLRARDIFLLANASVYLFLLLSGAVVAQSELPSWLATVADGIPLTHAIRAARDAAEGNSLADVSSLLAVEAAIGCAYFLLGLVLFRIVELAARRQAALETL